VQRRVVELPHSVVVGVEKRCNSLVQHDVVEVQHSVVVGVEKRCNSLVRHWCVDISMSRSQRDLAKDDL